MSKMAEMGLEIAELIHSLIVAERDMVNVLSNSNNNAEISWKIDRYNNAFQRSEAARRRLNELGVPYGV